MNNYIQILALAILAASTTLHARVGERISKIESRLERLSIQYPDDDVVLKLKHNSFPLKHLYKDDPEESLWPETLEHTIFYKKIDGKRPRREDIAHKDKPNNVKYPEGWDLHAIAMDHVIGCEIYRRNDRWPNQMEIERLLLLNSGGQEWTKLDRDKTGAYLKYNYELKSLKLRAWRHREFLFVYMEDFDKYLGEYINSKKEVEKEEFEEEEFEDSIRGF